MAAQESRHREFDEFYRATGRRTLRYAYAVTGDLAAAQDLTQEAYIRAWQRWPAISGYDQVEAWLRLVVTRLANDRWRRLAVHRRFMAGARPALPAQPPGEDTVLLAGALRQLPVPQRRVLAMHYLLDLPVSHIAAEVGVPEGTVKSWLSRGRTALATLLAEARTDTSTPAGARTDPGTPSQARREEHHHA